MRGTTARGKAHSRVGAIRPSAGYRTKLVRSAVIEAPTRCAAAATDPHPAALPRASRLRGVEIHWHANCCHAGVAYRLP